MARPPITRAAPYTPTRGEVAGQTFTSERQYRNALARAKGFPSWRQQQRAPKAVRTEAAYAVLKPAERQAHGRALDALNLMRTRGLTTKQAAREARTTVEVVQKYAGSAIRKEGRRNVAAPDDRLLRRMRLPTGSGVVTIDVTRGRTASTLGRYGSAIERFLKTGDTGRLREFRGKSVRAQKRGYRLFSDRDLDTLYQLAGAGELAFEDLYELTA